MNVRVQKHRRLPPKHWLVLPLLLIAFQGTASTQNETSDRRAVATRVETTPKIDGLLDEPEWKVAIPVADFVQHEPVEGQPASEKTEVFLIYDSKNLYVGVMCYDREPSQILVSESERDSELTNTDAFWMVFDTFHDRQNGFVFGTNPSGLEYDAQVSNEGQGGGRGRGRAGTRTTTQRGSGRGINKNWDANWEVATHTNAEGWMAEFRIPFSTLRFRGGGNQVWGVNFARNIRRKNEQDYWSSVPRQWDLFRLTFAGELHGLEVEPPTNFKVTPYVIGSVQRDFQGNPDGDTNYLGDAGLDVKYSLTPSMTLDLTYNTDFAQVEVDEQQVNLTRFNLFFPEKRPFFLENAGLFAVGSSQQVDLFFSRRIGIDKGVIVPIVGGARLTGKVDRWNVGFLNMQTETVGDCALGSADCLTPGTNFTMGRAYREFGQRSRLGGILINKQATGSGIDQDNYNRTFALDGRLGIGEAFLANGYVAKTATFHESEGEGAFDGSDHAYSLRGEYRTRTKRIWLEFTEVGEDFNPEVGFLRRKAYKHVNTGIFTYFRPSSVTWLRELRPHVTYRVYHDLDGFKESEEIHMDSHVEWENGARFSPAVNITLEGFREPFEFFGVTIPPGSYRNVEIAWRFNSNPSAPLSVNVGLDAGGFYNGSIRTYAAGLNWRRGSQLTTSVNYTHNKLDFPVEGINGEFGGAFKTNLVGARVNYSFTPRIFLQSLLQYNDGGDNWSSNIRFGWLNTAGTGLYVVYNETRDLEGLDRGLERFVPPGGPLNRALYIKFTREFRPF
ncbi:carbohydrate binding family 9 domain-containing protein [Acidobacteria bacterium AH-259-G07]|nr:carbohydrate binding family 9 domain-containing protein [Acidobacteria bacterium AH-259-G07]